MGIKGFFVVIFTSVALMLLILFKTRNVKWIEPIQKQTDDKHPVKWREAIPRKTPHKHIYMLKTHKCGSSTLYTLFLRFGYLHYLTFVLPDRPKTATISRIFKEGEGYIQALPKGQKYDILCHHTTYNRAELHKVLKTDTIYIGLVREPLARFVSAFVFFKYVSKKRYLNKIRNDNMSITISNYLKIPALYEPPHGTEWSHTHNDMALDFGFPHEDSENPNKGKVAKFLAKLDKEFDLVIVLEYLDESLILMKRLLNWSLKDILYCTSMNIAVKNTPQILNGLSKEDRRRHKIWESVDFQLYEHFLTKLKDTIRNQGASFYTELDDFRTERLAVKEFCSSQDIYKTLKIPTRNGQDMLIIDEVDCKLLKTLDFLSLIKQRKMYARVMKNME